MTIIKINSQLFLVCSQKDKVRPQLASVIRFFVIGAYDGGWNKSCEGFDSTTRKFTLITTCPSWMRYVYPSQITCVGYKVYFFLGEENNEVKVYSYGVKKDLFSFKTSFYTENTESFRCTKVSMN